MSKQVRRGFTPFSGIKFWAFSPFLFSAFPFPAWAQAPTLEEKPQRVQPAEALAEAVEEGKLGGVSVWESSSGYGSSGEFDECKAYVLGNRLLVSDYAGFYAALNLENGRRCWLRYCDSDCGNCEQSAELFSGPVACEGKLFITSAKGEIFAFEASEESPFLWKVDLKRPIKNRVVGASGRIFVQDGALNVHALDAETGKLLWTHPLLDATSAKGYLSGYQCSGLPLVMSDDLLLALDGEGNLSLIDAVTGEKLAKELLMVHEDVSQNLASSALLSFAKIQQDNAQLFIATAQNICALDKSFISRDKGIGTDKIWEKADSVWSDFLLHKNKIYYTTLNGELVCLYKRSGLEVWKRQPILRGDHMLGAPMLREVGGKPVIVVPDASGVLHGFDPETGNALLHLRVCHEPLYGTLVGLPEKESLIAITRGGKCFKIALEEVEPYKIVFEGEESDAAFIKRHQPRPLRRKSESR